MNEDAEQLLRYAQARSEDAFAALVQRNLPLVYAAALRRVGGDVHRAEDVAQLVFTAVARQAAMLARHPDFTGWLFTATRFIAAKAVRTEQRRRQREQLAQMTHLDPAETPLPDASAPLRAVLDEVLMELKQLDRQMILLRFHRGLRLAEIGAQLEVTENAVQKRLDRALDQLKEKLARRGMTSTAAAVALALEAQSAVAVPAGLAAAATTAGLACATGAGGLLAASGFMIASKLQVGVAAAVVVAASTGLVWEVRATAQLRTEVARQAAASAASTEELTRQVAAQSQRAAAAEADAARLREALQAAAPVRPAPPTAADRPVTDLRERAEAAMLRARQLEREGKLPEALEAFLACYRDVRGRQVNPPMDQTVMTALKNLGGKFPPALAALRALRDAAALELRTAPNNRDLVPEIALLDDRLGDSAHSMALYDSLPVGHPGRQAVGSIAHSAFVEARRYSDALVGKSFGSMIRELDMRSRSAGRMSGPSLENYKAFTLPGILQNIEVLTGTGKLEDARVLTEKLLAFDDTEATRAALKRHVERAHQPGAR